MELNGYVFPIYSNVIYEVLLCFIESSRLGGGVKLDRGLSGEFQTEILAATFGMSGRLIGTDADRIANELNTTTA